MIAAHAPKLAPRTGVLVLSARASCRRSARSRPPSSPSARTPGRSASSAAPPTPRRRSTAAPASCSPTKDPSFTRQVSDALQRRRPAGHPHHRRGRRRARGLRQERRRARRGRRGRRRPQRGRRRRRHGVRGDRRVRARLRLTARRRSPAWPAPATSSPPCSPRARATAAPASCSPRACRREEIGAALGQTAEAVASVPLLDARLKEAGVDAPVLQGPRGDHRGQRRARPLARVADRSQAHEEGAERKGGVVSVPDGHSTRTRPSSTPTSPSSTRRT